MFLFLCFISAVLLIASLTIKEHEEVIGILSVIMMFIAMLYFLYRDPITLKHVERGTIYVNVV